MTWQYLGLLEAYHQNTGERAKDWRMYSPGSSTSLIYSFPYCKFNSFWGINARFLRKDKEDPYTNPSHQSRNTLVNLGPFAAFSITPLRVGDDNMEHNAYVYTALRHPGYLLPRRTHRNRASSWKSTS
jgi:hypothetical protein